MRADELVVGIDAGASKTVAWLAQAERGSASPSVVGRGTAAGGNPQAVGIDAALGNLEAAISAAFADARITAGEVDSAVAALAGSDRPEVRERVEKWAADRAVAKRFRVVHDAEPVLAAGTPHGWGVALIAGTGSFAFARDPQGNTARSGGWGYLFGDEGSAYWVALAGLQAAAKAADGRRPPSLLLDRLLEHLELDRPEQIVACVYRFAHDRRAVAALAPVVTESAVSGDPFASRILDQAANELADMLAAAAVALHLAEEPFPLALAGGLILGSEEVADRLVAAIRRIGLNPSGIQPVDEPVAGAVRLASASR